MPCTRCNDSKQIPVSAGQTCPHCEGRGEYYVASGGGRDELAPCSSCFGRGKFEKDSTITCWWCVPGY